MQTRFSSVVIHGLRLRSSTAPPMLAGLKILTMPKLSPSMEKGRITAWHASVGENVEAYNLILDVCALDLLDPGAGNCTTDANMEVEIIDSARVCAILHKVGDTVRVNTPIAILSEEDSSFESASRLTSTTIPDCVEYAMWQAYKKTE